MHDSLLWLRCFLPFQLFLTAAFALYGTLLWPFTHKPPVPAYVQLIHPLIFFANLVGLLFTGSLAIAATSILPLPIALAFALPLAYSPRECTSLT